MAVQASPRYPSRQARNADATKAKERRLKIFVAIGGVVLLLVLVFEVPKTLKELSSNSTSSTPPAATVPTSSASATTTPAITAAIPGLKRISHLPSKDPFVSQVSSGSTQTAGASAASGPVTVAGPAVSTKHFKAKDPFIAQVATPTATAGTPASPASSSTSSAPTTSAGSAGGYIVVLDSVPAARGANPAKRAEVAAKNLGIPNVQITNSSKTTTSPYTIFSGPYKTSAGAQLELVRALRLGYSQAYTRQLPKATTHTE